MFAKSFVLAAALISAASPALAWRNGGGNGWNNGGGWHNNNNGNNWGNNGWNQPPAPQVETVTINVDRWVGNETLPLRRLGGLGNQYNGRTLRSVVVELNPGSPASQLQLLVNGQVVANAYSAGKPRVELRPSAADTFGSEVQTLQLRTIGWASIDDIEVNVARQASYQPQPQPQPQPVACQTIARQLNTQVGFGQISLNNLFNLSQYPGCRIGSVTLVGSTAAGFGQVAGLVNGTEATNRAQVAAYPGQYLLTFWNAPATGGNAPQVALKMMGNFTVNAVRINLVSAPGW